MLGEYVVRSDGQFQRRTAGVVGPCKGSLRRSAFICAFAEVPTRVGCEVENEWQCCSRAAGAADNRPMTFGRAVEAPGESLGCYLDCNEASGKVRDIGCALIFGRVITR